MGILLVIIGGIILVYAQDRKNRIEINEYLYIRGCTLISISSAWFDGDKYNSVYKVEYRDSKNRYHRTKCKIRSYIFFQGEIYWEDGIF